MVSGGAFARSPKVIYIRFIGKYERIFGQTLPMFLIQHQDGTTTTPSLSREMYMYYRDLASRPDLCYAPNGLWPIPRQPTIKEEFDDHFGFNDNADIEDDFFPQVYD